MYYTNLIILHSIKMIYIIDDRTLESTLRFQVFTEYQYRITGAVTVFTRHGTGNF